MPQHRQDDADFTLPATTDHEGWDEEIVIRVPETLVREEGLVLEATDRLRGMPGVDAVFIDKFRVYVVTREHGDVDREALLRVEDTLSARYGDDVSLCVRAHQGRGAESVLSGPVRIL